MAQKGQNKEQHPEKSGDTTAKSTGKKTAEEKGFPGYPAYPPDEDIYSQAIEEADLNPEQPTTRKAPNERPGERNEKNFSDVTGSDLDIPGAELDDQQEEIGTEDEENNYYSLGGDDKEGLEEDPGDKR